MHRRFGYQQSSAMRHEVQQDSFALEAWKSKNQFNRSSGMEIMPGSCIDTQLITHHNKFGGQHSMQQNGWHGQHMHHGSWQAASHYGAVSSGGKTLPFSDCNASNFSNGSMMKNGMEENAWSLSSARYNQDSGGKMKSSHYNQGYTGKRVPFNGCNASSFSNGGVLMNNVEETAEYDTFEELHTPTATRTQEMRYERSSWADNGNLCRTFDDNINLKPSGFWMAKGL